jgi:uncharacterized protein involved in outer membrane biogenesis
MRLFKIIAISLVSLIVLVGLLFAALILFVDPNNYKPQISAVVKEKTDLDLALNDRLSWTLWPNIGVKLGKLALTEPTHKEQLLGVDKAEVSVQLMPLLSKQIAINAVSLDGAQVRFVTFPDGTTSWDHLLTKLKNPNPTPASSNPSAPVKFNINSLDIRNSALALIDLKAKTSREVKEISVQASQIGPDQSFPLALHFVFSQQDAAGKTLLATNDIKTQLRMTPTFDHFVLTGLSVNSDLSGTQLPAPASVAMQADVDADLKQQLHKIDKLVLDASYQDPKLSAPATVKVTGTIVADMAKQIVNLTGLTIAASYPDKAFAKPLTASLSAAIGANLKLGAVNINPLTLQALGVDAKGQLQLFAPALGSDAKPGTPITSGLNISGDIATAAFNPRSVMATLGMAAPKTQDPNAMTRASLSTGIAGSGNSLLLKNLKVLLDSSTLTGEAGISDFKSSKLYAHLNLDKINADGYLPPPAPPGAPVAAAPAPAGNGGLLPVELIRKQNLDISLNVGSAAALGYAIAPFSLAATAGNGLVNVSTLKGNIYGGSFSFPASIDVRGAQPQLSVKPLVSNIEVGPVAQKILKKDLFTGKINLNGVLTLQGNSVGAWKQSLSGTTSFKFDNGILHGVNMMQVVMDGMGKYAGVLALDGKNAAGVVGSQSDTPIGYLESQASINNGVVNQTMIKADLQKAQLNGAGTFNLVSLDADYHLQINLDRSVLGPKLAGSSIPVRCKGNVATPAKLCGVDGAALRDTVLKAALSQQLQGLGVPGGDVKAAVDQKKAEVKQQVQQQVDEQKKKAADKLQEQLGKGLQGLFGK